MKSNGCGLVPAAVRDPREHRGLSSDLEIADFETGVLAGFVPARASAGPADATIRNDTDHLELILDWFGRPLWQMQSADADAFFGKVLRAAKPSTRTGRAVALGISPSTVAALHRQLTRTALVLEEELPAVGYTLTDPEHAAVAKDLATTACAALARMDPANPTHSRWSDWN